MPHVQIEIDGVVVEHHYSTDGAEDLDMAWFIKNFATWEVDLADSEQPWKISCFEVGFKLGELGAEIATIAAYAANTLGWVFANGAPYFEEDL